MTRTTGIPHFDRNAHLLGEGFPREQRHYFNRDGGDFCYMDVVIRSAFDIDVKRSGRVENGVDKGELPADVCEQEKKRIRIKE
jgi:hypothetical protein